jgi:hypothetical protein
MGDFVHRFVFGSRGGRIVARADEDGLEGGLD